MNDTMNDSVHKVTQARPQQNPDNAPLNPALKQVRDASYGRDQQGTDPMDTVSLQKDEGKAWPMIWATVTVVCVAITLVLLIF